MFGILLWLYTWLRVGELLALKWEDIDLQKGILTVSKSCHDGKDKCGHYVRVEDTPKTSSSRRVIPLPRQLLLFVKEAKKKSESEYVVAKGNNPLSVRSYQRSFDLLQKKLKIPHRGFHSLRHTFATRALLSDILGHKFADSNVKPIRSLFNGTQKRYDESAWKVALILTTYCCNRWTNPTLLTIKK